MHRTSEPFTGMSEIYRNKSLYRNATSREESEYPQAEIRNSYSDGKFMPLRSTLVGRNALRLFRALPVNKNRTHLCTARIYVTQHSNVLRYVTVARHEARAIRWKGPGRSPEGVYKKRKIRNDGDRGSQ